ncbi:hypothetical protein BCR36DRAFT_396265 [Piromyces finnis]|uniref:Uncharacterized protein n=1 Tax=Piromyces finnis TaxID=1754191 RepID=A0A1Y1VFJ7_9FUNG|nr:hypothetical protein BCR36DRAFT_396265 [Piromyces finnis]|eukprot:ORX54886.1 hypothetical protein BCR36DRAFT_396265 [Piromyces finnis]
MSYTTKIEGNIHNLFLTLKPKRLEHSKSAKSPVYKIDTSHLLSPPTFKSRNTQSSSPSTSKHIGNTVSSSTLRSKLSTSSNVKKNTSVTTTPPRSTSQSKSKIQSQTQSYHHSQTKHQYSSNKENPVRIHIDQHIPNSSHSKVSTKNSSKPSSSISSLKSSSKPSSRTSYSSSSFSSESSSSQYEYSISSNNSYSSSSSSNLNYHNSQYTSSSHKSNKTNDKYYEPLGADDIPERKSSLTNPLSIGIHKYHLKNSNDTLCSLGSIKEQEPFSYYHKNSKEKKYIDTPLQKIKSSFSQSKKNITSNPNLRYDNITDSKSPTISKRTPNHSSSRVTALNSPKTHIYKSITDNNRIAIVNNNMKMLDDSDELINCTFVKNKSANQIQTTLLNNQTNLLKNCSSSKNDIISTSQRDTPKPTVPEENNYQTFNKNILDQYQPVIKNSAITNYTSIQNNLNLNTNYSNINYDNRDIYLPMSQTPSSNCISSSSIDNLNNNKSAFEMETLSEEIGNITPTNFDTSSSKSSKRSLKEKLLAKKLRKQKKKEAAEGYTIQQLLEISFPCKIDNEVCLKAIIEYNIKMT